MDPQWCYEHYLSHRSLLSADNVRAQLKRVMERNDITMVSTPFEDPTYYTNIRKAMTVGFFMQVAKKAQGAKHYVTVKDQQIVSLHPSTVLETLPEWVIYNEYPDRRRTHTDGRYVLTTKSFIRTVTNIRPEWLLENAESYYDLSDEQAFPRKSEVTIALSGVVQRMKKARELAKRKAALAQQSNGKA
jgi:pre-mRNA-splicing factor ATP-dependent RNA helicase DHX15/PRP43